MADIGRAFEIYFDGSDNGRGYSFFPTPADYRITLEDLRRDDIQKRLRAIWENPRSIDPRLQTVDVTRAVAASIAKVARKLDSDEKLRIGPLSAYQQSVVIENTTLFIIRLLFCMFAEDVG